MQIHQDRLSLASTDRTQRSGLPDGQPKRLFGGEDAIRAAQLVGPHRLPILSHADCSVLVVRGDAQPLRAGC